MTLDEIIDHMVDALQREHETNAVHWARCAEDYMLINDPYDGELADDDRDDDYWEGYFYGR